MRELFSFALVALAVGCSTPTSATQPLGQQFKVKHGETVQVEGGLSVTFVRVAQDSRCPQDVQCIQAGDGVVVFELHHAGDRVETELHTAARSGKSEDAIDGFSVALKDLEPYPVSTVATRPEDYVATLVATRAE
jgi:hypothetical protein